MAASYTWPATLPQAPGLDFRESVGTLILRTEMDAGPAKQRRRGQRPDTLSMSFVMTTAQVATLRTFVDDTIKGVARFYFPHPRTAATIEARIVPTQEGELFVSAYLAPGYWQISMTVEALP
jgi:hypothetical protein